MKFLLRRPLIYLLGLSLLLAGCGANTSAKANVGPTAGNVTAGEEIFAQRGCVACHSLEAGQVGVGPSLAGVASRSAQTIAGANYTGQAKTVEAYLFESITQPHTYVAADFSPIMPKTYGRDLTEQELADLISYLLTLK
jgi:nitric oxide reductase subunit C